MKLTGPAAGRKMSGAEEAPPRESAAATRCWVRVERWVRPGRRGLVKELATMLPIGWSGTSCSCTYQRLEYSDVLWSTSQYRNGPNRNGMISAALAQRILNQRDP